MRRWRFRKNGKRSNLYIDTATRDSQWAFQDAMCFDSARISMAVMHPAAGINYA
jgi:hypothetical protein